ncbi:MAG: DUF4097 family beta strand repeat-containing protein [Bacteroidota bacterium]
MTRIYIQLLAFLFFPTLVNGQEVTVPLSDPSSPAKLVVDFTASQIQITGTDRKDILIKYKTIEEHKKGLLIVGKRNNTTIRTKPIYIKDKDSDSASREGLKKVSGIVKGLEVNEYKNEVELDYDNLNKHLHFEIEVPKNIDLDLEIGSTYDLTIKNINGKISLETFGGDILAEEISGSLVANTQAGNITVQFNEVKAEEPLSFATFSGDIDLTFPADLKANFKLHTETGDIFTGFDMEFSQPFVKEESQNKVQTFVNEWVHSELNGGGSEITIKNYAGDILIRKK